MGHNTQKGRFMTCRSKLNMSTWRNLSYADICAYKVRQTPRAGKGLSGPAVAWQLNSSASRLLGLFSRKSVYRTSQKEG